MNLFARRVTVLLLIASVSGPAFATGTAEEQATTAKPSLIMYAPGSGDYPYDADEEAAVYAAFSDYVDSQIGATVEVRVPGTWGDYDTKVPLLLASSEDIDLVWTSSWSNKYEPNINLGYYAPLEDLLPVHAPETWARGEDWRRLVRWSDGHIYYVDVLQDSHFQAHLRVLKEFVDTHGIDLTVSTDSLDQTMADLTRIFAAMKEADPDIVPLGYKDGAPTTGLARAVFSRSDWQQIVARRAWDKEVIYLLEDPTFLSILEQVRDWYLAGYTAEDAGTIKRDEWDVMFNQGKVLSVFHWAISPSYVNPVGGNQLAYYVPIGEPITLRTPGGTMWAVPDVSENKGKAVELMDLMLYDTEAASLIALGIEGRHYRQPSPGRYETIPGSGYTAGSPAPWVFAHYSTNLISDSLPSDFRERAKALVEAGRFPLDAGFVFDTDPVAAEVANVNAVIGQYRTTTFQGVVDTREAVRAFDRALKDAGIEAVIAEYDKQLQAFLERQGH